MNGQVLTRFTNLFSAINNASALLAGDNNPNFENIVRSKYAELNSFNEYIELSNEINEKLYLYPQSNKELFLLNILKGFKYSKYLNITLDNQDERNRGLTMTADRIKASHNCINNYINGNIDEDNICAVYIVLCWEELSLFIQELDKIAQSHNLNMSDIQIHASLNIWYKVEHGVIQNNRNVDNDKPELCEQYTVQTTQSKRDCIFNKLKENKFISVDTDVNSFMYVFGDNKYPQIFRPIKWLAGVGLLAYFINQYTEDNSIWKKTEFFFVLKNGDKPKRDSMKNAISKIANDLKNKPQKSNIIDDILKE